MKTILFLISTLFFLFALNYNANSLDKGLNKITKNQVESILYMVVPNGNGYTGYFKEKNIGVKFTHPVEKKYFDIINNLDVKEISMVLNVSVDDILNNNVGILMIVSSSLFIFFSIFIYSIILYSIFFKNYQFKISNKGVYQ